MGCTLKKFKRCYYFEKVFLDYYCSHVYYAMKEDITISSTFEQFNIAEIEGLILNEYILFLNKVRIAIHVTVHNNDSLFL